MYTYACDVTKDDTVRETVSRIEKEAGPIYVVVNNAGGVSTRPFHMETMERFWYQIELNFKAVWCPSLRFRFHVCVFARIV